MFHIEVPLRTLLVASTVAAMAVIMVQRQAEAFDPAELARVLAEVEGLPDEQSAR